MPYFYSSGEEIKRGDRVIYGGESCEVQFVAEPSAEPTSWYVTEHGGGVMVTAFGCVFLNELPDDDLVFVARNPATQ